MDKGHPKYTSTERRGSNCSFPLAPARSVIRRRHARQGRTHAGVLLVDVTSKCISAQSALGSSGARDIRWARPRINIPRAETPSLLGETSPPRLFKGRKSRCPTIAETIRKRRRATRASRVSFYYYDTLCTRVYVHSHLKKCALNVKKKSFCPRGVL